jgi:hypothetical protein
MVDLPEKQHAGLSFSLQSSPHVAPYPQEKYLQTSHLAAISNKYGRLFIGLSDSVSHIPTRKLHGDPDLSFSALNILIDTHFQHIENNDF